VSDRLGIEHQTVLGLPPVEFANLAADLQCRYIAIVLSTRPHNPHRYAEYSLLKDAALRRRMRSAMRERDVSVFLAKDSWSSRASTSASTRPTLTSWPNSKRRRSTW
jgi:hypothetical protein